MIGTRPGTFHRRGRSGQAARLPRDAIAATAIQRRRSAPHHAQTQQTVTSASQHPMRIPLGRAAPARAPEHPEDKRNNRYHRQCGGAPVHGAGGGNRRNHRRRIALVMMSSIYCGREQMGNLGEMRRYRCPTRLGDADGGTRRAFHHWHQQDSGDQQRPQQARHRDEEPTPPRAITTECHAATIHLHPIPVVGITAGCYRTRRIVTLDRRRHERRAAMPTPPRRYAAVSRESFRAKGSRQAVSKAPASATASHRPSSDS